MCSHAEKSIGVFCFGVVKQTYDMDKINSFIRSATNRINTDLDELKTCVEEEINIALDEIKSNPTGSNIVDKSLQSIREKEHEAKFKINISRFKIHFDDNEDSAKVDIHTPGLLFDFATDTTAKTGDADFTIGTHIFISTRPGIDLYIGCSDKQIGFSIGIGIEAIMHDLQYKQYEATLPYVGVFMLAKCDVYIGNWKMFAMYKYSKWPLIGRDHSVGLGLAKVLS